MVCLVKMMYHTRWLPRNGNVEKDNRIVGMPFRLPEREENYNSHNTHCAERHESGFKPAAVRSHISDHLYSLSVHNATQMPQKAAALSGS
jgi:hypothetical protein